MSIFYLTEHTSCSEYLSPVRLGFRYMEFDEGIGFNIVDKKEKHLFFIMEGEIKIRYNEFKYKEFKAGDMVFLPKSADVHGEAINKCSFIVLIYDAPVKLCDKVTLNSIVASKQDVQYEFRSLPMCQTLNSYLALLKTYLSEGINCRHLHEIKQKELFLILRTHYSKDDLAQFFYPMLGDSLDFRSKVMAYYPEARTAKELAGLCLYSEGHFSELFIAEFSETPYKWMQKQKAKHIIGRMANSDVSLKELADEFNFTSPSHFNSYCKTHFGDSPARVRRKLQAGNEVISK